MVRKIFLYSVLGILFLNAFLSIFFPPVLWSLVLLAPFIFVGFADMLQKKHAVKRNFPIIGRLRYLLEAIRPEISQYFIETNTSGVPFSREERSLVYQRAKGTLDTIPFGTQKQLYLEGYEWVNHSLIPQKVDPKAMRVKIGSSACNQPYSASLLNIGAMSFGSISRNAVLALNQGARMGNFAQNTGEGGLSSYHLEGGGDLIWQIGSAYFGCRTQDGKFCENQFAEKSQLPNVKMIEIKLSQGAKPGYGGILPAAKVSQEIAAIRGVPPGVDCISPPAHSTFHTPLELLEFVVKLRKLSGGKPIGWKLCVGQHREFMAICKAMVQTGITPDFISVDGGEGGTGAAPLEFANYIGSPLIEGLIFVHNCLVGFELRERIKIISGGKIISGFGILKQLCMGADLCFSSRGMMLALGCIQALRCNTNRCPVGVTTQDPGLVVGLVVEDKNKRVARFHENTIKSFCQILGAMGLHFPEQLRPWHLWRRISFSEVKHYGNLFPFLIKGDLLKEPYPKSYAWACQKARVETFEDAELAFTEGDFNVEI